MSPTKELLESGGRWKRVVPGVGREAVKQSRSTFIYSCAYEGAKTGGR